MKTLGTPGSGAIFSDDMKYRYRLWRVWNPERPRALFILLNPSTAGDIENDATIERQQRRVMAWGAQGDFFSGRWAAGLPGKRFGSIEVVNVYAFRSTNPSALYEVDDPDGPDNSEMIHRACGETFSAGGIIVCGWGTHPTKLGPSGTTDHDLIVESLTGYDFPLSALKLNSDGTPCHPLYLDYELKPRRWFNGELREEVA